MGACHICWPHNPGDMFKIVSAWIDVEKPRLQPLELVPTPSPLLPFRLSSSLSLRPWQLSSEHFLLGHLLLRILQANLGAINEKPTVVLTSPSCHR